MQAERELIHRLLDEIEENLLEIERRFLQLDGENFRTELEVVLRAAHNIKGASQLYGLVDLGKFVHEFESLLLAALELRRLPDADTVDLALKVQEKLIDWIHQLRLDPQSVVAAEDLNRRVSDEVT